MNVFTDPARAISLSELLEEAWRRGRLAAVLYAYGPQLDRDTAASFQRVAAVRPHWRDTELAPVIDRLREATTPPVVLFDANSPEFASFDASPPESPRPPPAPKLKSFAVEGESGPIRIRLDQAFAARRWGVWYTLDAQRSQVLLDEAWVRSCTGEFWSSVRSLNRLGPSFVPRRRAAKADSDVVGIEFERLILDILNEEELVAFKARLEEDLLEKTDLRVRLPGLDRGRGARLQVTSVTDPARHNAKVTRITRSDEYVVLSPLTLATAAWSRAGTPMLPRAEAAALFRCIGGAPENPIVLAARLRQVLTDALAAAPSPLGPLLRVPTPIRGFIRSFVAAEARASTSRLRQREAETGRLRSPTRGK